MLVLSPTAYADGKKGTQLYVNRMSRELPLFQITNQVRCSLHKPGLPPESSLAQEMGRRQEFHAGSLPFNGAIIIRV